MAIRKSPLFLPVIVLVVAWGLALVVVNPRGEFPLNDDWLYARSVQAFLKEGTLVKPQLAAASLVFQTLWGAGIAGIFGFSHTVLRVSNLILHFAAGLAVSALILQLTGRRALSMLAGLTFLFSPLALVSAFSFMWEPSLAALVAFGLLALDGWERTYRWRAGVPLTFFSFAAVLVHPLAIILPLWLVLRDVGVTGLRVRRAWPGITALIVGILFLGWHLSGRPSESMTGFWISKSLELEAPFRIFMRLPGVLLYLGLFLLPVGLTLLSVRRALLGLPLFLWAWGQGLLVGGGSPFPLPCLENTLTPSGIGFVGLQGFPPRLGFPFWLAISILATLSVVALIGRLSWWKRVPLWAMLLLACLPWGARLALGSSLLRAGIVGLFGLAAWLAALWPTLRERGALAVGLVWLLLLLVLPPFYDRYLVPLLPLFLVRFVASVQRITVVGWASVLILAVGSAAGVHDYLAVNRTRWDMLNELTIQKGIDPSEVDGGYEWAGWHYAWEGVPNRESVDATSVPWWITLWAPQIEPQYVVSLSPLPGMTIEAERTCATIDNRWRVFLLRPGRVSYAEPE